MTTHFTLRRAATAAVVLAASLSSFAQGLPRGEYRPVGATDTDLFVAARLATVVDGSRYALVETRAAIIPEDRSKTRLTRQVLYSVDCSNMGVEPILTQFNLEQAPGKEPRWASAPSPYAGSFNQEAIKHTPVTRFVAERNAKLAEGLSPRDREEFLNAARSASMPDDAELAVSYGCLTKQNMSEAQAAQRVQQTAGLADLRSLACITKTETGQSFDFSVRFEEASQYVQINGRWISNRTVDGDRIYAKWNEFDMNISRTTGSILIAKDRSTLAKGSCEVASDRRKF